jgi:hypothetical protein
LVSWTLTPAFGNQAAVCFDQLDSERRYFCPPKKFLTAREIEHAKCVILDVRMLELQAYVETTVRRITSFSPLATPVRIVSSIYLARVKKNCDPWPGCDVAQMQPP